MSLVVLFFVLAGVLTCTLIYFSRAKGRPTVDHETVTVPLNGQPDIAEGAVEFLGDAIFSKADWDFIQKEESPILAKLFREERRSLAARWLKDNVGRIRSIRENHLRNSRYSRDLDVLSEVKLLILFLYLTSLCQCMLLAVRVAQPSSSRTLALHFEKMAGRLGTASRDAGALAHASAEEPHRSHP